MDNKNFVKALRDGSGYDWLCTNGNELSKEFLLNSLKQFLYETKGDSVHGVLADSIEHYCLEFLLLNH